MKNGKFIISLDFELHWGGVEKWDLGPRKTYFDNTRIIVEKLIDTFEENKIPVTWATVGILFAETKQEFIKYKPNQEPNYSNQSLNYYSLLHNGELGIDEKNDPYHFAASLVERIKDAPLQELATHTFTHYYCNEEGQIVEQFKADLKAAQNISEDKFNTTLQSIVFPRNQFNKKYIASSAALGIKVLRSNPDVWFWNRNNKFSRIFRAFDTLTSISRSLTFDEKLLAYEKEVLILPASRFFRPYSAKEKAIQNLKMRRIRKEMEYAAINKKVYHLWWHPHNFGYFPEENLLQLQEILVHYKSLHEKYNFKACSMIEMYKHS